MIPSFTFREKLPSGPARTHDVRLAASQDVAIFSVSLSSEGKELQFLQTSQPSHDPSSLGFVYVYPGVVKFQPLQEVTVIPSYLSRSHVEAHPEVFNRSLKVTPSDNHQIVIHPGDQIVFPSGTCLALELSESVQVESSLPGGEDEEELTALPATFPSSPPGNHPAIEETPRGRYQRTKNMSATQENSFPSFNPTDMMTVESQPSLRDGSQSPIYHTARDADQLTARHDVVTEASHSNIFVDLEAPDSKTSASTSHIGPVGISVIDDSVHMAANESPPTEAENAVGNVTPNMSSKQSDQTGGKKLETGFTETNQPYHKEYNEAEAQFSPTTRDNLIDTTGADNGSTTEEESIGPSELDLPREQISPSGSKEAAKQNDAGESLPRRGRSKRKVEEKVTEIRATSKRTKVTGRASKETFDEEEDGDEEAAIVNPKSRSSPHEPLSAPMSSTSSSLRASLSEARGVRVLFSNANITSLKGVKATMKELSIREVNPQKPNSSNYDLLVVGDENGEVKRTLKLLASLVLGKPVVTEAWLEKCLSVGRLVDDYAEYAPPEAKDTIDRSAIFAGRFIFISSALRKFYEAWEEITYICRKAGAKQVLCGSAKSVKEATLDNTIRLVAGGKDKDVIALNKMGYTCYSKDLLTTSILRGQIDWQSGEHEEFRPPPKTPSKKTKRASR